MQETNKISKIIFSTIIFFLLWVWLTASFRIDELITGFAVSIILAVLTSHIFTKRGLWHCSLKRILYLILYIPVYAIEVLKANFQMAAIVLSPKFNFKPGFIIVKTDLRSEVGKLMLANSITLTPGTITLDVKDDKLLIHWIDIKEDMLKDDGKPLIKVFQKYIKEIWA